MRGSYDPLFLPDINLTITCPSGAANCVSADTIKFNWQVINLEDEKIIDDNAVYVYNFRCPEGYGVTGISPNGEFKCIEYASKVPVGDKGPPGLSYLQWAGNPFSEANVRAAMKKNCGRDFYSGNPTCPGTDDFEAQDYSGDWYGKQALAKKTHFLCEQRQPGHFEGHNKDGVAEYSRGIKAFDFSKPGCPEVKANVLERDVSNPCSPGCFAKGTSILLADGTRKKVEEIQPGDFVWNPITGQRVRVAKLVIGPEYEPLIGIITESDRLIVTSKHPILVDEYRLIMAKDVKPFMTIFQGQRSQGSVISIETITPTSPPPIVYNLWLEGDTEADHFVLSNGIISGDFILQQKLEYEHE